MTYNKITGIHPAAFRQKIPAVLVEINGGDEVLSVTVESLAMMNAAMVESMNALAARQEAESPTGGAK